MAQSQDDLLRRLHSAICSWKEEVTHAHTELAGRMNEAQETLGALLRDAAEASDTVRTDVFARASASIAAWKDEVVAGQHALGAQITQATEQLDVLLRVLDGSPAAESGAGGTDDVASLVRERDTLRERLMDREQELDRLRANQERDAAALQEEYQQNIADLEAETAQLNQALAERDARLQDNGGMDAGSQAEEIARLRDLFAQRDQEVARLDESANQAAQVITHLREQLDALQGAAADTATMQAELDALRKENEQLQETVDRLERAAAAEGEGGGDSAALQEKINRLEAELVAWRPMNNGDAAHQTAAALEDALEAAREREEAAVARAAQLSEEIEALRANVSTSQAGVCETGQPEMLEAGGTETGVPQVRLQQLEEELAEAAAARDDLFRKFHAAREELGAARRTLQGRESELATLRHETEALRETAERISQREEEAVLRLRDQLGRMEAEIEAAHTRESAAHEVSRRQEDRARTLADDRDAARDTAAAIENAFQQQYDAWHELDSQQSAFIEEINRQQRLLVEHEAAVPRMAALEQQLAQREAQLSQRDATITQLQADVARLSEGIAGFSGRVAQAIATPSGHDAAKQEHDAARIHDLEAQLAARDQRLAELDERLAERASLRSDGERRAAEAEAQTQETARLREEVAQLNAALEAAHARNTAPRPVMPLISDFGEDNGKLARRYRQNILVAGAGGGKHPPFGELLVEAGVISPAELTEALRIKKYHPDKLLGAILLDNELATEDVIAQVIAAQAGLPLVEIDAADAQLDATALFGRDFCDWHVCVPLRLRKKRIVIAIANPRDTAALKAIRAQARRAPCPVVATPSQIFQVIAEVYGF